MANMNPWSFGKGKVKAQVDSPQLRFCVAAIVCVSPAPTVQPGPLHHFSPHSNVISLIFTNMPPRISDHFHSCPRPIHGWKSTTTGAFLQTLTPRSGCSIPDKPSALFD